MLLNLVTQNDGFAKAINFITHLLRNPAAQQAPQRILRNTNSKFAIIR
ncbi:hypothetical protein Tchar_01388 [Tepidimonas charontis]|uniref:Uncharacterized protein n=1 Tax=Tepidimonas charontis TaxID=2267262 RepID=A0A554XF12_9BURK|nr:hypothetical protein Tchar_01388 [Tepidimonas charontis]